MKNFILVSSAVVAGAPGVAPAQTYYDYKVSQVLSLGELGDIQNQVFAVDLAGALGLKSGSSLSVTGIGWDLELATNGLSKLSDMRLYIDDMVAPDGNGIFVRPGANDTRAGVGHAASPVIDLTSIGMLDLPLPTGVARLEFHELFDDPDTKIDGIWISGTIRLSVAETASTVVVPLPSVAGLGIGGLLAGLGMRRRRGTLPSATRRKRP